MISNTIKGLGHGEAGDAKGYARGGIKPIAPANKLMGQYVGPPNGVGPLALPHIAALARFPGSGTGALIQVAPVLQRQSSHFTTFYRLRHR